MRRSWPGCIVALAGSACLSCTVANAPSAPEPAEPARSVVLVAAPAQALVPRFEPKSRGPSAATSPAPMAAPATGSFRLGPAESLRLGNFGEIDSVIVADLDGDRRDDIVVAPSHNSQVDGFGGRAMVFRQSADGELLPRVDVLFPDYAMGTPSLAAADLDGDGREEVLVGLSTGFTAIHYESGAYVARTVRDRGCDFLAVIDLDPDGIPDVACLAGNLMFHFLADGAGSFQFETTVTLDSYTFQDLKVGDVTGDGRNDLLLYEDNLRSILRVYPGSTAGLESPTDYPLADDGANNGSVTIADLDSDHRADVVFSPTPWEWRVDVMYQSDAGVLGEPMSHATFTHTGASTAGDFDGDNDLDLVVHYPGSGYVGFLEQAGGSLHHRFDVPSPAGMASLVHAIDSGDFDGDGCRDVAVVDGANLTIHRGIDCGHRAWRTGGPGRRASAN